MTREKTIEPKAEPTEETLKAVRDELAEQVRILTNERWESYKNCDLIPNQLALVEQLDKVRARYLQASKEYDAFCAAQKASPKKRSKRTSG